MRERLSVGSREREVRNFLSGPMGGEKSQAWEGLKPSDMTGTSGCLEKEKERKNQEINGRKERTDSPASRNV